MRRWLADVRRFPGVGELTLGRLDRVATGEQLAGLLGRPPHQSLVDDVYTRSQGNAYLTTLLGRGLSPDARSLPAGLPTDLREAATRAWRGLSAPAQAADPTGRRCRPTPTRGPARQRWPLRSESAAMWCRCCGRRSTAPCSTSARTAPTGSSTRCWPRCWRHGLLPEERATLHAAFAAALEPAGDADEMGVEQVVDLADHHYRAGHRPEAYRWALLAADAADQAGGATEMLRLLRRALDLWPQVPEPGLSRIDLLRRIQAAAEQDGRARGRAGRRRRPAGDRGPRSSNRCSPPSCWCGGITCETQTGRAARRARRRTGGCAALGGAPEQRGVRAGDSRTCGRGGVGWPCRPARRGRRRQSVSRVACGSAKALAYALITKVTARVFAGDGGGLAEAQEAQAAAAQGQGLLRVRQRSECGRATAWTAVGEP